MTCAVCGSDAKATIHQPEPERHCKRPDEHHEFVADQEDPIGWRFMDIVSHAGQAEESD